MLEVKYAFILFRLAENRNTLLSGIGMRLSAHMFCLSLDRGDATSKEF